MLGTAKSQWRFLRLKLDHQGVVAAEVSIDNHFWTPEGPIPGSLPVSHVGVALFSFSLFVKRIKSTTPFYSVNVIDFRWRNPLWTAPV